MGDVAAMSTIRNVILNAKTVTETQSGDSWIALDINQSYNTEMTGGRII